MKKKLSVIACAVLTIDIKQSAKRPGFERFLMMITHFHEIRMTLRSMTLVLVGPVLIKSPKWSKK